MVPVEAQAAGKPVIAFAAGGALETVVEGRTGTFFHEPTVASITEAIQRCFTLQTDPHDIATQAARFSRPAFRERLTAVVQAARAGDTSSFT
jgi:glycosyltransferase involved in cell wall biosynthesis